MRDHERLQSPAEMQQRAAEEVSRARRFDRPLGFALFEIDHFADLKSELGNDGARLISAITARVILTTLRSYDHIGRWSEARFGALFPEANETGALSATERVIDAVRRSIELQSASVPVTLSVGVAVSNRPAQSDARNLIISAATALERAQLDGGNRAELERLIVRRAA